MNWYLERNYDWMIRKKIPYNILDRIICKGIMTDIEMPRNEIMVKRSFIRILNRFNFVNWWKENPGGIV